MEHLKKIRNENKNNKYANVKKDNTLNPTKLDKEVLRYMYLNGGISQKILTEKFGYTEKKLRRFKKLSHHNIIKEIEEIEADGQNKVVNRYVYTLSKEGTNFAAKNGWGAFPQHYNGYDHTLKSEEFLYNLINDKSKNVKIEDILNENTQKHLFAATIAEERNKLKKLRNEVDTKYEKNKIGDISIVDFAYKNNLGKYVACEIVTEHYKERHKINHRNYSKYVLEAVEYIEI